MEKIIWLSHCWSVPQIKEEYDKGYSGVAIGSDSCLNKVPSVLFIKGLINDIIPKKLVLITPHVNQEEVKELILLIQEVNDYLLGFNTVFEIVVNDWGVLSQLKEVKGINVTAGLNISLDLLNNYPEQNSIREHLSKDLLSVFEDLKIRSISTADIYNNYDYNKFPLKYPINLTLYTGNIRISSGRICYVNHNGRCKHECFSLPEYNLPHKLDDKHYDGGLYNAGNEDYTKMEFNVDETMLPEYVTQVIYNKLTTG